MALSAFDSQGYLGDVATNKGWFSLTKKFNGTILKDLAVNGYSESPESVARALSTLNVSGDDRSVVDNLVVLARRAKEIIIISDGVS